MRLADPAKIHADDVSGDASPPSAWLSDLDELMGVRDRNADIDNQIAPGVIRCHACGSPVKAWGTKGLGWAVLNYKCCKCGDHLRDGKVIHRGKWPHNNRPWWVDADRNGTNSLNSRR